MRQYPFIYSQRDPQWAGNQLGTVQGATIGAYGCILTSHAMKAGYYGHEVKPNALNDIYTQKNLYLSGDLLSDADLSAVFSDITLIETTSYADVPADLNHLKTLATDPTLTVTIEVDFDHDPNDGIQTHFVELHDFDGTTLTIYDPWYGTDDDFTLHYGTNIAQTIQKIAVYKGSPVAAPVTIDAPTFQKLVTNSTSYDAVCDTVGEPHNTSGDKVVADINKIKADKSADDQTIVNLNKQIPDLEGQISTLNNQVTDLQQKLVLAQQAASHPDTGQNYQDLYNQAESDIKSLKDSNEQLQQTYNRAMAQYKNTSALLMPRQQLFGILIKRFLGLA
jgi:hypothetical protein